MKFMHMLEKRFGNLKERLFVVLIIVGYSSMLPHKAKREARRVKSNCSMSIENTEMNRANDVDFLFKHENFTIKTIAIMNMLKPSEMPNATVAERQIGCSSDRKRAICHTYIHSMYKFYSTIGGFLMLAIVATGISFLIVTHFHGRHIVKTKQHVVEKIEMWDVIQHRKQQARERNGNWI